MDGTSQILFLIPYYYFDVQVLDRGEKIELLVDKTENLRSQVTDSFMTSTLAHLILHVCRSKKENMNSSISIKYTTLW